MQQVPQPEQQPSGRRNEQLADEAIRAAVVAPRCLVCGMPKPAGRAFCATDFLALSLFMRDQVSRTDDPEFPAAFRRAAQHLADHPHREVRILPDGSRWRYFDVDQLTAAGYRFLDHARCVAPTCNANIVWYRTPSGSKLAVNLRDCLPHRATCKDPDYLARRRALLAQLRTSARRRTR